MKTQVAKAAKQLKKELKAQFPDVKFSVTSESYTGGSSVTVSYSNGPEAEKVKEIADYWEAGSFNGMVDLYEYDPEKRDRPTAKYVFVNRSEAKPKEIDSIPDPEVTPLERIDRAIKQLPTVKEHGDYYWQGIKEELRRAKVQLQHS